MTIALPVSVEPVRGEAIDSWLERLAYMNGLSTADLMRTLTDSAGGKPRFLTLAPDPRVVARLARLGGVPAGAVRSMTLAAHPAAVDLHGLDPADGGSFRVVAARGWVSGHGTQLCPRCLAADHVWRLVWRLPIVAVCAQHSCLLATRCPGCLRPFRDQGHSPLRPSGSGLQCGNPVGHGPAQHCPHLLTEIVFRPAPERAVATQQRIDRALSGEHVQVVGEQQANSAYLTNLRSLTTLLLHLATQVDALALARWPVLLRTGGDARARTRGPRWGISPPRDPSLRAGAISTADEILSAPDVDASAAALAPWIELTPASNDGALGWLADRTVMTATLTRLITATLAPHRRLSHRLDNSGAPMNASTRTIPQVIPQDLFAEHLTGLIDSGEVTTRAFASLCIARTHADITTWAVAAEALDLPAAVGTRTARACSARMTAHREVWTARLTLVAAALPRQDYRVLEQKVRHRTHMSRWYEEWARRYRPGSHFEARPYALIWQWIHVAHGHIDAAPAWSGQQTVTTERARYRQFENSLDRYQQQGLAAALHKRA